MVTLVSCSESEGVDDLPSLDLSVVTYNSSKWIAGFFESLVAQDYPLRLIRILVRDNNSTDDTVDVFSLFGSRYEGCFRGIQLTRGENIGFGYGHNRNLELADAPYFLVSNVDLEFAPDAIQNAIATAEHDDERVASWEFRQKPFEHPKWYDPVTLETRWSSSACVLFRRSSLESVSGYEERIFMYGEDVELSYRLRDHGFLTKYCPKAVCWHFTYEEAGQFKPGQFFGSTLANIYIRLRYGSFNSILTGVVLFLTLWISHPRIPGVWQGLARNSLCILRNSAYFLRSRKRSRESFPFCGWDYERAREGAFYRCGPLERPFPRVSVVMRTYRGRQGWLSRAVASVQNQTYPNIELVVVEDGSEEAAPLMEQIARSGRLASVVYRSIPKGGRCKAGNAGLKLATGELLAFLDDDDLFFAEHIETLVSELIGKTSIGAAYSLAYQVPTRVHSTDPLVYEEMGCDIVYRQPFSRPILWHHNYIPIQAVVFRRTLYDEYGGFDESLENLEDWNLWTRYSLNSDFLLVEKATSLYRVPDDQERIRKRQLQLDEYYALAVNKQRDLRVTLSPADIVSYANELSQNLNAVVIPYLQIRNTLVKNRWLNLFYYTAIRVASKIRSKRRPSVDPRQSKSEQQL